MSLLSLTSALGAPPQPSVLEHALEIRALCEEAVRDARPCEHDRTALAHASIAVALSSLVGDGTRDEQVIADAWALDPKLARGWYDLVAEPTVDPSWWVQEIAPKPTERLHFRPARFWTVGLGTDASLVHRPAVEDYQVGTSTFFGARSRWAFRSTVDVTAALGGPTFRGAATFGQDWLHRPTDLRAPLLVVSRKDLGARRGSAWIAGGYTWGGASNLQVVAGPRLEWFEFSGASKARLVKEEEFTVPAYGSIGLEARSRGRLQARNRIAGVVEPSVGFERRLYKQQVLTRVTEYLPMPTVDVLRLGLTVELQVRLFEDLWLTADGRTQGQTHLGATPLQLVDTAFVGTGVRWRSD